MTRLYNDPADFRAEVIDGFAAAYGRYVERVPEASGFVRRGGPRAGKVSLVVGGGSGHYPSYSGIVGRGFADGCVLGDVFTSPSAEQVYRVGRAAAADAGLVLAFGNYAGDRLNFAAAQERLVAEGVDTRIVYVTDDIASAEPHEPDRRRGIAGTFAVYKVGGAAADTGADLHTVERLMRATNDATFSFGVAFDGCTFPGQTSPLFTMEHGQMELGLGIHGEPGIESRPRMSATDLADVLVEAVLAERPERTERAAIVVNGLGATKYEELFLLHGHVDRRLRAAGVVPVMPEVGELVTSLDMAGCSLSVTWLDDEIEEYWTAPADTAAFRRGNTVDLPTFEAHTPTAETSVGAATDAVASPASVEAASSARSVLHAMCRVTLEHEDELGRIDAVAGDGDHGAGMARGFRAAVAAADATDGGVGAVLRAAGDAFGDKAGGTSGILWGILLCAIGDGLGTVDDVTGDRLCAAVGRGACTVQRIGEAQLGDKTMLDSLLPFVDALTSQLDDGRPLVDAWRTAAVDAVAAAEATAQLVPRVGRARPLAERSIGTPDPGATSMGLVLTAAGEALHHTCSGSERRDAEGV